MNTFLKKSIVLFSIAVVVFALVFLKRDNIVSFIDLVKNYSVKNESLLKELKQEIFAPPLRSRWGGASVPLSPSNIIDLTNKERIRNGLDPMTENELLDKSAMLKVRDMFDRQYFEHLSPEGNGPGYLADVAGYSYVVIGENLAMGTFKDDASLVKAWMDSDGHRKNILNTRYREIGVAVGQGIFDGERVYIIVQEFGKPSSECPNVSGAERLRIDNDREEVDRLNETAVNLKKTIDSMPNTTTEENSAYNAKIAEYNIIVSKYNSSVNSLRAEIDTYNRHVREFNACAER